MTLSCILVVAYMCTYVCAECVAPLLLEVQSKLNFTHILAGASAIGKASTALNHSTPTTSSLQHSRTGHYYSKRSAQCVEAGPCYGARPVGCCCSDTPSHCATCNAVDVCSTAVGFLLTVFASEHVVHCTCSHVPVPLCLSPPCRTSFRDLQQRWMLLQSLTSLALKERTLLCAPSTQGMR